MTYEQEVKTMTDEQLNSALIAMANVLMQGMGRQPLKKRQNAAKFRKAIIQERQRRKEALEKRYNLDMAYERGM